MCDIIIFGKKVGMEYLKSQFLVQLLINIIENAWIFLHMKHLEYIGHTKLREINQIFILDVHGVGLEIITIL